MILFVSAAPSLCRTRASGGRSARRQPGCFCALGGWRSTRVLQPTRSGGSASGAGPATPGGTIAPLELGTDFDPGATSLPLFHGVADEVLMRPIRAGRIKSIKFNRGGSSISLRIDFTNGARAAFKPRQTNPQTVPRREIAAYRLNRMVGSTQFRLQSAGSSRPGTSTDTSAPRAGTSFPIAR